MDRTVGEGRCARRIEYRALPSQARFHDSRERFKGFSGPIGSGKSQALCHEAIKLSYVNAGRLGLVGAPTYPMLRDATQTTLRELLEDNGIPYELYKAENVIVMKDTGSKILLRAVEEFERLRGTNLAWFGIDELTYVPEEAWLRLEGRLRDPRATRLCGFAVWTPKGQDWVYRRFIHARVAGYEAVIARPMENIHVLSQIPDFYERLKQSYDEKFYRQEVLGEYLNMQDGLVYHAFRRDMHIREAKLNPLLPLLWALDFNVDPMSSIIAQIVDGTAYVLDEIVLSRASTQEACEEFCNRFPSHQRGLVIYGDASGTRQHTSGTTDFQVIRDSLRQTGYAHATYKIRRANPPVRDRVAKVNAKLLNAAGEVQLYVSPRCKELIRDFEEVGYKTGSSVIDKDRDHRRTHLSDALGYLIWEECGPKEQIGERNRRLI